MERTLGRRKLNSFIGIFFVILSTLQTPAGLAAQPEISSPAEPRIPVQIEIPEGVETIEQAKALIRSHASGDKLFVSSDNAELISASSENPNAIILPYGDVAKPESQNKFLKLVHSYKKNFVKNFHRDKIGISIVTINTGINCYQWIHSGRLSTFEETGTITFTILSAILISLNKDAWAQLTAPIQEFYKSLVGKGGETFRRGSKEDLAFSFAASLTLSTAISSVGALFLPMDKLVDSAMFINAWTMPALIGFVSTIASFAWSKNIAAIDEPAQPFAKYAFRRIQEVKGFFLGITASTAMLFTPAVYGVAPWAVLVSVGAAGLLVYLNSDKVATFFETTPIFRRSRARISRRFWKRMCKDLFLEED